MIISLVLPVYNLRALLPVVLRCLEAQTLARARFECIFVDDGSTDGSADFLERYETDLCVRVLRNGHNLGRSRTRNRGSAAARGEWVVFLDGDMLASPTLLEAYVAAARDNDAQVLSGRRRAIDLGAFAGTLAERLSSLVGVPDGVELFSSGEHFAAIVARSTLGPKPDVVQQRVERAAERICEAHGATSLFRCLAFITSNVAVRRDWLAKTEGFYPFLTHGEDTEMGMQLAELGARFTYVAGAVALHPFWERESAPANVELCYEILVRRHPFKQIPLFYLWARYNSPGAPPPADPRLASLLDMVALERSGELAGFDIEAAIAAGGIFPLRARFATPLEQVIAEAAPEDREAIAGLLHDAVARGWLAARRQERTFVDAFLVADWLNRHGPTLERRYRASAFRVHHPLRARAAGAPPIPKLWPKLWEGRFVVTIPDELRSEAALAVNLPLPVDGPLQRVLALELSAPRLERFRRHGQIIAAPVRPDEASVGFTFRCEVAEWSPALTPAHDAARWRQPTLPARHLARLEWHLVRIGRFRAPRDQARAIYEWMLREVRYCLSPLPEASVVDTGYGACTHHARLFVDLCRLAGVPARERCGAMITTALDGERARSTGPSPFSHTWAEYCAGDHWAPVELLALCHGERMLTAWNFADEASRKSYAEDGARYADYYFEGLDPLRIHTSVLGARLPTLVTQGGGRWSPVGGATLTETLTCRALAHGGGA